VSTRGQAVLETALTLPLLLLLTLGFLAMLVFIEGNVELSAATSLAAASAASAPPDPNISRDYAQVTFDGTMHGYTYLGRQYLEAGSCSRHAAPNPGRRQDYVVSCTGHATLLLRNSPMAALGFADVALTATATAYAPRYRSRP
jgi:hypothetical protein